MNITIKQLSRYMLVLDSKYLKKFPHLHGLGSKQSNFKNVIPLDVIVFILKHKSSFKLH